MFSPQQNSYILLRTAGATRSFDSSKFLEA